MTTPAKPAPPTPTEVEALAEEYRKIEAQIDGIEERAVNEAAPLETRRDQLWELLLEQTKQFGSAHAEKSKLLYGVTLEVMATFGSSSSIDNAAVEIFRLALVKAKQSRMLKGIFAKSVRWNLLPEAATFVRAQHDAKKLPAKLYLLFARCAVPKELTPKLVVRERS